MKVYVGYRYYPYEGCTEPEKVFSTKEKAEEWKKEDEYREYEEIEVEYMKYSLMNFYLKLLAEPVATPNNNFYNLRYEVLKCLANELGEEMSVVQRIFERMAEEDK